MLMEFPITVPSQPSFTLSWNTSEITAETLVMNMTQRYGGDGFHIHVTSGDIDVYNTGQGTLQVRPAEGDGVWCQWWDCPGVMHAIYGAFATQNQLLDSELESPGMALPVPTTGLFWLDSIGRKMWRVFIDSIQVAWRRGALRDVRLHVLAHQIESWHAAKWKHELGIAKDIFAGLHWCDGSNPNRFERRLRRLDNYLNKIFTMLSIAKRLNYQFIVSIDDDIMLPPSALSSLVHSGRLADASRCGVVLPMLQNGIPSTELWAASFLETGEIQMMMECFSQSSARWVDDLYTELEPLPNPWDAATWYRRLKERLSQPNLGMHPVRGNETCQSLVLGLALSKVHEEWPKWRDHQLMVDSGHKLPYFVNNGFLMRTDLFEEALEMHELIGGRDEEALNLLLNDYNLPLCFVANSFGLHPAYGTHHRRPSMEEMAVDVVLSAIRKRGTDDDWIKYIEQGKVYGQEI